MGAVADETRNGGTPGHRTAPSADELRADERAAIAWFHVDAGRALESLGKQTIEVGRLVELLGPDDPEVADARRELQRATGLLARLLELQFTDLA